MKRKVILSIVLVLGIAGALAGIKMSQIKKMMAAAQSMSIPPETISSTMVKEEVWQITLNAIGSISAVQGVTITPDIPGSVREIAFESGAVVKQGDLLVRLDTSTEEAQLRAVKAQVDLAKLNADRLQKLREQNMVSQSELDAAEAGLKQQAASADAIIATIEKKTIRAPFAGRLGIRHVNLGEYLDIGKPIASLNSLAPVYVDFWLPQQELSRLETSMVVRVRTDAYPGKVFEGKLTAINPDLDERTRSVALQGTFENKEQLLRPGMFVKVEVVMPEEKKVFVVPSTAVLSAPFGDSVYVIEPNATNSSSLVVRQQFIKTGLSKGDFVSVDTGLKGGEKVVRSGAFKLRNGLPVVENNDLVPDASRTPRPPDS